MNVPVYEAVTALFDRFGLDECHRSSCDPIVVATEAAVAAGACDLLDPVEIGLRAIELCPPGATTFEKGMAFGLALALNSEAVEGHALPSALNPPFVVVI